MNNLIRVSVAVLCVFQAQAHAGVFRCAVNGQTVYSDTKCEADSKPVRGLPPKDLINLDNNPIAIGRQLCKGGAPAALAYKDPGSVQVGQVYGGDMVVIDFADKKMTARAFYVPVNAKNSYGGYVGEKPITCYTSDDGRKILRVTE